MRDRSIRRRYRLSAEGRAALVAAIRRTQPWRHATGPRTPEGKARSARNGLRNRELWRVITEGVEIESAAGASRVVTTTRIRANGATTIVRESQRHART